MRDNKIKPFIRYVQSRLNLEGLLKHTIESLEKTIEKVLKEKQHFSYNVHHYASFFGLVEDEEQLVAVVLMIADVRSA